MRAWLYSAGMLWMGVFAVGFAVGVVINAIDGDGYNVAVCVVGSAFWTFIAYRFGQRWDFERAVNVARRQSTRAR
jgi:hypothetical protein